MSFSTSKIIAKFSGNNWLTSNNIYFQQLLTGDFNGDGLIDYLINRNIGLGEIADTPAIILQNQDGTFYDATLSIFKGRITDVEFTPRILV